MKPEKPAPAIEWVLNRNQNHILPMLLTDPDPGPGVGHSTSLIASQEGEAHHLGRVGRELQARCGCLRVTHQNCQRRSAGWGDGFTQAVAIGRTFVNEESSKKREKAGFYRTREPLKRDGGGLRNGRVGWSFVASPFSENKRVTKEGGFLCFLGAQGSAKVQRCQNCSLFFYFWEKIM